MTTNNETFLWVCLRVKGEKPPMENAKTANCTVCNSNIWYDPFLSEKTPLLNNAKKICIECLDKAIVKKEVKRDVTS